MNDGRKSLWPWILALLIGLPVVYVLSFGPALWLICRGSNYNVGDQKQLQTFKRLYYPVLWIAAYGPEFTSKGISWWGSLGLPSDDGPWFKVSNSRKRIGITFGKQARTVLEFGE